MKQKLINLLIPVFSIVLSVMVFVRYDTITKERKDLANNEKQVQIVNKEAKQLGKVVNDLRSQKDTLVTTKLTEESPQVADTINGFSKIVYTYDTNEKDDFTFKGAADELSQKIATREVADQVFKKTKDGFPVVNINIASWVDHTMFYAKDVKTNETTYLVTITYKQAYSKESKGEGIDVWELTLNNQSKRIVKASCFGALKE